MNLQEFQQDELKMDSFKKSKIINEKLAKKPSNKRESLYFMHIPKTGGTYTKAAMSGQKFIYGGHKFCAPFSRQRGFFQFEYFPMYNWKRGIFGRSFKFSIVRNPFDWLASYYHHEKTDHSGWASCNDYHGFESFPEFIEAYCSDDFEWHVPFLKNFMLSQLFDENGKCRADLLIPIEKIELALPLLASKFYDVTFSPPEARKNVSKRSRLISEIYSNKMIQLVEKKCERELSILGYSKEGFDEKSIKLDYDGCVIDPSRGMYKPQSDELRIKS